MSFNFGTFWTFHLTFSLAFNESLGHKVITETFFILNLSVHEINLTKKLKF